MAKQSYKEDGKRARPEYVLTEAGEALRPGSDGSDPMGR